MWCQGYKQNTCPITHSNEFNLCLASKQLVVINATFVRAAKINENAGMEDDLDENITFDNFDDDDEDDIDDI